MHKLILCDDHSNHNRTLKLMLERVISKHGVDAHVELATTDANEVIRYAQSDHETTVYFLDICLSEDDTDAMDGIALGRIINAANPRAYIVYISAFSQYALDCCHNHAFDFLIKPFSERQLAACLTALFREAALHARGISLAVVAGSRTILLDQSKVLCFKKDREYILAHILWEENNTVWREGFLALAKRLQPGLFVQCHKSYYVNRHLIKEARWSDSCLVMIDNSVLPMSRRREKQVRSELRAEVRIG